MAVVGHEEAVTDRLSWNAADHSHRLGGSCRFVQQRGISDLHTGQVDHHGLEVEQCLEPSLRNFGLVGGVLGVPARVLQDVALDHRWGNAGIVAGALERAEALIVGTDLGECPGELVFAYPLFQVQGIGDRADRRGQGPVDKLLEAGDSEEFQHRRDLVGVRADMPVAEFVSIWVGLAHFLRCRGPDSPRLGQPSFLTRDGTKGGRTISAEHRLPRMSTKTGSPLLPYG